MKKGVLYLMTVLIVFSGCSNFLGPSDPVQSRAARSTPSDSTINSRNESSQSVGKPSKAAPSTPAKVDVEK